MFKVAYFNHKVIAKEEAQENNIDELLEFHNKIIEEKNLTFSNAKNLEFYTRLETA